MSGRDLTRREALAILGLGTLAVATGRLGGCAGAPARRGPNVVLILGDDHRHDALGCAGHPWIRTPSLDRLASGGVRFTNAFVTTSLCSPSRASFLTGLYAHNHGVLRNEERDLDRSLATFPGLLQAAGWRTGFVGKWHQARSSRPRPGFERWVGFKGQGDYERNTLNVDDQWVLTRDHITDVLTGHALEFLTEDDGRPFCLVLAHKAAHDPFIPAARHRQLYNDAPVQPATSEDDFDWRAYGRTLAGIDDSVGAVLDRLDRLDRSRDTLVIYAGDNGMLGRDQDHWADKRLPYEPSIRIPLLMRLPGVLPAGATCDAMALNLDVLPTVLGLCGVAPPVPVDGADLLPAVRGTAGRDAFLYEYFPADAPVPPVLALRTTAWKYIVYPRNPELPDELYHLVDDPGETHNLASEPTHGGMRDRLRNDLLRLWRETGGEGAVHDNTTNRG